MSTVELQKKQPIDISLWLNIIHKLCATGGPKPDQYVIVLKLFDHALRAKKIGQITEEQLNQLRLAFGTAFGIETMQGRSLLKKYGYAGDFEIIDDIYQKTLTDNPNLRAWDVFYHAQGAAKAVRNRKKYFKSILHDLVAIHGALGNAPDKTHTIHVLNVASGPCRDVAEFFEEHPHALVHFTCVDADAHAIEYAKRLCSPWLDRITFIHKNAFKLQFDHQFELVWSAGLLDYFEDRAFSLLLNKFIDFAKPATGQVIVGNFVDTNPSIAYLEFGEWMLNHRSPNQLRNIAIRSGVPYNSIKVESEEEGINLFLRITKP